MLKSNGSLWFCHITVTLFLEEKIEKSNSANAARKPHETQQKSSSSSASLVDGVRIFEELNRPGLYKPKFVYIFAGREKLV